MDHPRSAYQSSASQSVIPPSTILSLLLKSSGTVSDRSENDEHLLNSIERASSTETVFALRAAESSKLLKAWCEEVGAWRWPGTFEAPFLEGDTASSVDGNLAVDVQNINETDCIAVNNYWVSCDL